MAMAVHGSRFRWLRRGVPILALLVVLGLVLFVSPPGDTPPPQGDAPSVDDEAAPAPRLPAGAAVPASCDSASCDDARLVVAALVELWWFGEPATLGELADPVEGLTTAAFNGRLVAGSGTPIQKLNPDVHLITGSFADELMPGELVVVRLEHRDVGSDVGAPSQSFFDVVYVDGTWRVDAVTTR